MLKSWLLFALQKSFVVARNFMRSRRKEVNKAINIVKKLRFSQLYLIFIKKYVIIYGGRELCGRTAYKTA
jgi:hypothetical protein